MNLEQLRGFVEVARLGHFTRAAEHLHLAQPSLSRQISALESDLGAELFHRARGHISLTAAGEALLPLARRMLADADTVRREMAELAGLRRGRVRLGATPTLCISLVAEAVSAFHGAHPGIDLHVTEGGSRVLIDELAGGALDLALITEAEDRPASLTRTPLLTEELVVVSSAAWPPVSSRPAIDLRQLARLPQIVFHESYDLRVTTEAAFRAAGLTPSVVLEGAEMDAVLRFVERGLGVAVVPAMVLLDRPALRSVRLTAPRLTRTVSLAHRSDVTLTRAAAAMQRVVAATAEALAAGSALVSRAPARGRARRSTPTG
ncbi:LysR family transcriptional regulator [Jiangella sp. DSM 45060]|uniref:LysR family transcriptional regulator n=1 Tax=Jiangella sp. DSM 45060 TaxID=1798224 RepID=UPI00087B54BE|nr:LysR substrate-binding domain-containing protein [Jiangella sp. DSM 45060]SDT24487.1 DNA-binding transcriptional regulator, LysR family [Jiangella sp. DSM 45060]